MGRDTRYYNESALESFKGIPVDFSVYRIMYQLFEKGILDTPREDNVKKDVRTEQAKYLSLAVAQASMVLLKNDQDALPLKERVHGNILMIGDQLALPVYAGGGSGSVHEASVKSPLDSMCDLLNVPRFEKPENATGTMMTCSNNSEPTCIWY